MEKDLVEGQIGTVGGYELDLHGSQLAFTIKAAVPMGGVDVVAKIEIEEVLKLISAKIPGQIDEAVFALIIGALKA